MTIDMGVTTAKTFGDLHEADNPSWHREVRMDLANNARGRSIGDVWCSTYTCAYSTCKSDAANGRLVTLN